jgi:hypothetical protein
LKVFCLRRFGLRLVAGIRFCGFAARAVWFFVLLSATLGGWLMFSLASACCLRASGVAPVRGGTYFSLPPQRKVGKRKRLTPLILVLA